MQPIIIPNHGPGRVTYTFATVPASEVIAACNSYLRAEKQRHSREQQEMIEHELTRKWFRAKTREEAAKRAMSSVEWRFLQPNSRIKNLLSLACLALKQDAALFISAEDAAKLIGHWGQRDATFRYRNILDALDDV